MLRAPAQGSSQQLPALLCAEKPFGSSSSCNPGSVTSRPGNTRCAHGRPRFAQAKPEPSYDGVLSLHGGDKKTSLTRPCARSRTEDRRGWRAKRGLKLAPGPDEIKSGVPPKKTYAHVRSSPINSNLMLKEQRAD